jgi:hypothetical protein
MEQVKQFIDNNYNEFSNLDNSEVSEFNISDIDSEIVEYLKTVERFDYRDICIYYVERDNNVWVENMNS